MTKKIIKFHGLEVDDVTVVYSQWKANRSDTFIQEFNALEDPQVCETINVQVVSEFVTITFYKNEKTNSLIKRDLVPIHKVERISVKDKQE